MTRLLIAGIIFCFGCQLSDDSKIAIEKEGTSITISGHAMVSNIRVIFKPFTEAALSSYNTVSPHHPAYEKENNLSGEIHGRDIIYPIVNVKTSQGFSLTGVVIFDSVQQTEYSINGMFFHERKNFEGDSLVLNSNRLFEWENNLYLQKLSGLATGFILVDSLKYKSGSYFKKNYQLLHPQWEGEILALSTNNRMLAQLLVENNNTKQIAEERKASDWSKKLLTSSLKASIEFTLRSQNNSENDPAKGGFNLFYDYETKSFRRSTWLWSWGPSIKMLLESSDIPEITAEISRDSLVKTALKAGETTLNFQNQNQDSPAYGIATSRWSETLNMGDLPYEYEQFYSVADGQFLAGWGWIPLYSHTGDERFLKAAQLQTEATARLMGEMEYVPMDYMENLATWKGHMISEQGFGMEGINELYQVDPNPSYKKTGSDYLEMLLAKLAHPSGGWNRAYIISSDEVREPLFFVRGHGWAMEGLTAGYDLTRDPTYLKMAMKMAELLMKHQLPNGSWSVVFTEENMNEISDKGTALWSLLFYRMYRFTQNEEYLIVARKALQWCLEKQYSGEDIVAHGSIPNISRSSGVIYRDWFPMACIYTTGFFGLAVMEELKIMSEGNNE